MQCIEKWSQQQKYEACRIIRRTKSQWIDHLRKAASTIHAQRASAWQSEAMPVCDCANRNSEHPTGHSDSGGNMDSVNLQSIAERGLGAFLEAVADSSAGIDLWKASDAWIRALETTAWNPGDSAEKFISRVTRHALTMNNALSSQ